MSYTIVVDSSEERIRYHGNIINISKRHCRIGKVTPKPPKNWGKLVLPMQPVIPWAPNQCGPMPWWQNPVVSVC